MAGLFFPGLLTGGVQVEVVEFGADAARSVLVPKLVILTVTLVPHHGLGTFRGICVRNVNHLAVHLTLDEKELGGAAGKEEDVV